MPASAKRFQFFAAASEDERVAAFEPHHVEAAPRAIDHHGADFFLRKRVHRFLFADVNAFAILGREIEQVFVGEVIVEDRIGDREQLAAFPGDEVGIAGAGADEIDLVHASRSRLGRRRREFLFHRRPGSVRRANGRATQGLRPVHVFLANNLRAIG